MADAELITKEDKLSQAGEMTFLEHLEALRWHLIRSVAAIVLFAVVMFISKEFVFGIVIFGPVEDFFPTYRFFCNLIGRMCEAPELIIQSIQVQEKFITHLKVSILLGIVVAFPYIFWEMWQFIKPGLYPKEQKAARGVVGICSFLFLLGVFFGYYVITPFALHFLTGYDIAGYAYNDVVTTSTLTSFVNNLAMYCMPAGIIFELPVVVYFLTKVGLITSGFLKKYRRLAFVIILVLSAIITPPDVMTQFLIGIPLYILYEISIGISKRVEKKQALDETA
ncbi:MAG: twin-arginine translocase subunit TatC [Saprospiraceae bacterium]|nr:twin-arginine translocase subunit TatC [Saprospiraceae bacterium]